MKMVKKILVAIFVLSVAIISMNVSANASGKKIADVSQYQGNINWNKAAKDLKYVLIRVQHGTKDDKDYRLDTHRNINANGAYKHNIPFGQYGFAEFTSKKDAENEAKTFFKHSNKNAKFYVLDNEKRMPKAKAKEQKYVDIWLKTMRKLTDKPLIYYSYQSFVSSHKIDYSRFDGSWIANYSAKPIQNPDLWQYTSHGRVSGIKGNVDLNRILNRSQVNKWFR
ncbi:GH25 family lysozyme [Apilactobacillus ozensis]|uniref:Glycosyl hydrolase family 25 n=1 Tax=Apilactobacillus ozensis DSM 23829 = JCM 17196 TaxID=1423781 RepID=A0A0R2AWK2_9LACO|nr:glycosyl hydrolase family 25 [Apilactobacillus ozensis DSM 23829 = JCM 17196]